MNIILFHHGQGLTDGVLAFGEMLRTAGHDVTTPDFYDGHVFDTLDEGIAYRDEIGIEGLAGRALAATEDQPADVVYAGFSLGTGPAQMLAQTKPGARGALLMHGCLSADFFGPWPDGVPLVVHTTESDPWVDQAVATALVAQAGGNLVLYPGAAHLFADPGSPDFDPQFAERMSDSVREWLADLEG